MRACLPVLLLSYVTLSCSTPDLTARAAREVTYAPSLTYLSAKKDVQPAMQRMAVAIVQIHETLAVQEMDAAARARVFAWLNEVETAAQSLERPGLTNHQKLNEHLDEFLRDVAEAKAGVNAEPPNYYRVGNLSGSCMYCHRRDAPRDFGSAGTPPSISDAG